VVAMAVSLILLGTRGEIGLVIDRLIGLFSNMWANISDSFTVGWASVLGAMFLDNPFNRGVLSETWSRITDNLSFGFAEVLPLMLSGMWAVLCGFGENIAEVFVRIAHGFLEMWRALLSLFRRMGASFSDFGKMFSAFVGRIIESVKALKQ
jgi:hypothetical protein